MHLGMFPSECPLTARVLSGLKPLRGKDLRSRYLNACVSKTWAMLAFFYESTCFFLEEFLILQVIPEAETLVLAAWGHLSHRDDGHS